MRPARGNVICHDMQHRMILQDWVFNNRLKHTWYLSKDSLENTRLLTRCSHGLQEVIAPAMTYAVGCSFFIQLSLKHSAHTACQTRVGSSPDMAGCKTGLHLPWQSRMQPAGHTPAGSLPEHPPDGALSTYCLDSTAAPLLQVALACFNSTVHMVCA